MPHDKGNTRRAVTTSLPLAVLLLLAIPPRPAHATTQTFNFTGAQQNFVVPGGVTQVTVEAFGAQGGTGFNSGGAGVNGGSVTATIGVTPGETLVIFVGGQGGAGGNNVAGSAGFNGGAVGGLAQGGGGGGGASDVRQGGSALVNRVVVAGGGGGSQGSGNGGAGGGTTGAGGGNSVGAAVGGGGGSLGAGGAGGSGGDGTAGVLGSGGAGGLGVTTQIGGGGGGGGGYFGGGGGEGSSNTAGGGGGSSFTVAGATNVTHQQGVRMGDGQVIITFADPIPTLAEWAQLIMVALLVMGGLLALRSFGKPQDRLRSGQACFGRAQHRLRRRVHPT